MKLLYIGDVMGPIGCEVLANHLPEIKSEFRPDTILIQAENVTGGKGMSIADYRKLKDLDVDGFMSGNHMFVQKDLVEALQDPNEPVTRPANFPKGTPGQEYKILKTAFGDVLLISLMGQIVGKDADKPMDNPLHKVDKIIVDNKSDVVATIVNFHGDYSSEKVVIGHYLDGKVAAVIGDHWHVPTADFRVLPKGTAHISDVGMVGTLNSSLGIDLETIITRWHSSKPSRNSLSEEPPFQFCAVLVDIDESKGIARSIEQIYRLYS
ncbi:MAG: TIGR00282 family metallophosphoesterase [Candidatus Saccharimonadales bacterium]